VERAQNRQHLGELARTSVAPCCVRAESQANASTVATYRHDVPNDRHRVATSLSEPYRQRGIYTGKIRDGAKPADPLVLQPMKS